MKSILFATLSLVTAVCFAEKPKNVLSISCKNGVVKVATGPNATYTLNSTQARFSFEPELNKAKESNYLWGVKYLSEVNTTHEGMRYGVGGGSDQKCDLPSKIEINKLTKVTCSNSGGPVGVDDPVTITIDSSLVSVTTEHDSYSGQRTLISSTVFNRGDCQISVSKP